MNEEQKAEIGALTILSLIDVFGPRLIAVVKKMIAKRRAADVTEAGMPSLKAILAAIKKYGPIILEIIDGLAAEDANGGDNPVAM